MKIARTMELSGLVVTQFGGKHTYEDAVDALVELEAMHRGRTEIYEIVINSLNEFYSHQNTRKQKTPLL